MGRILRLLKNILLCCMVVVLLAVGTRVCLTFLFHQEPEILPDTEKRLTGNRYTVLNLPLSISLNDLQQAIEQYVPRTYSDVDDDPTDLLVEDYIRYDLQRGPIEIALAPQGIHFAFPVSGEVKTRGKVNLAIVKVPASAHATVAGLISGRIAFEILSDWQVKPDLDFSVDINEALIPIENLGKISVRNFLETQLTKKIDKKRKKLVYKILDKNRVRKEVTEAWAAMHRVELINDVPPVWARVIPKRVGLMPLTRVNKNALEVGLQVVLATDLYLTETPPTAPVTPLPDADILDGVSDKFQIRVPFKIDAATINTVLAEKVIGRSETVARDIQAVIQRAEVALSDQGELTAILFVDVRHERFDYLLTRIRVYVTGQLFHDVPAGQIRLANVVYDAAFSRWWAGFLNWSVAPYLRHELARRLVFPLDEELETAHGTINHLITTLVVPPGIQADLSVKLPRLNWLNVSKGYISGELQLSGNLRASLDFPVEPTENEE